MLVKLQHRAPNTTTFLLVQNQQRGLPKTESKPNMVSNNSYTFPPTRKSNDSNKNNNHHFKILYWTISDDKRATWLGLGSKPFEKCTYKNCELTNNHSEYNTSDAVLFYLWYTQEQSIRNIRLHRPDGQKWIMHLRESPIRTHMKFRNGLLQRFNNLFNVTWTYHSKSDITTNYMKGILTYVNNTKSSQQEMRNFAKGKKAIVAGLVSNCEDISGRLRYIRNLAKYVTVDLYGKCGDLQCTNCYDMIAKNYKFYLSFENSICSEYITEKLWSFIPFRNIVPIVLGGGEYSKYLPKHSYVDVKDFKSPKDLAQHLLEVNASDVKYNQYFEWKNQYRLMTSESLSWQCSLCSYLNKWKGSVKTYPHLEKFWSKEDCKTPEQYYSNVDKYSWH